MAGNGSGLPGVTGERGPSAKREPGRTPPVEDAATPPATLCRGASVRLHRLVHRLCRARALTAFGGCQPRAHHDEPRAGGRGAPAPEPRSRGSGRSVNVAPAGLPGSEPAFQSGRTGAAEAKVKKPAAARVRLAGVVATHRRSSRRSRFHTMSAGPGRPVPGGVLINGPRYAPAAWARGLASRHRPSPLRQVRRNPGAIICRPRCGLLGARPLRQTTLEWLRSGPFASPRGFMRTNRSPKRCRAAAVLLAARSSTLMIESTSWAWTDRPSTLTDLGPFAAASSSVL